VAQSIANPTIADVPAAFARGEQRGIQRQDRARSEESRRLTGQILSKTIGGRLGELGKDLSEIDPQAALAISQALGIPLTEKERINSMIGDIQVAATIFETAGPEAAAQFAGEKAKLLASQEIEPTQYLQMLDDLSSGDPATVQEAGESLIALRDGFIDLELSKSPAGRKFSARTRILDDGSTIQTDTQGNRTVLDPAGNVVTGQASIDVIKKGIQEGIRIQTERAGGRAGATAGEKRDSALIERGIAAAESTATIRRALTLLDTVKTGGVAAISLAVKSRLGIEGADEGELSNSLGKAVLSQLRETFGAAFTESEGQRLERIEASFGKSPETNRRLLTQALRIAERTANRASRKAISKGLGDEAEDIRSLLKFTLDIEEEAPANVGRFQVEVIEE